MKILCKIIGHKIDLVEETIMKIKDKAINRQNFLQDQLTCKRCGAKFRIKGFTANSLIISRNQPQEEIIKCSAE
jgi:hypothetical protein